MNDTKIWITYNDDGLVDDIAWELESTIPESKTNRLQIETELWNQTQSMIRTVTDGVMTAVPDANIIVHTYDWGIQNWMDKKVDDERGYTDIYTCLSYENSSSERYATEAQAVQTWRTDIWVYLNELKNKILSGEIPLMSLDELIADVNSKFPLNWGTEPI